MAVQREEADASKQDVHGWQCDGANKSHLVKSCAACVVASASLNINLQKAERQKSQLVSGTGGQKEIGAEGIRGERGSEDWSCWLWELSDGRE